MRWEEAFNRLRQADSSLAAAFDQFYHQLEEVDRSKVEVSLQSYPFTTRVLDTGTAYWPDGSKVEDDYVVAKGLPFGVILSRSCEVFEYTIPTMPDSPKPTAILSKGACIGLFELFDHENTEAHGGQPDWSISAGSISIRSLVNFDAAGTQNQLRRLFGTFDTERFKTRTTLSEKAMFIPGARDGLLDWTVDILFFNKFWFDCLSAYKGRSDEEAGAAYVLRDKLYAAAWSNVSRIRAANTSIMRFLSSGLNTNADLSLAMGSYELTSVVTDAVYSRVPIYVIDGHSEDVAPMKFMCEELLKPFMKQPVAIRPAYLGEDYQVGYMPLEFISPFVLQFGPTNHNTRDKIVAMAQRIRNASDSVLDENVDLPILAKLEQLFDNIAFKVPASSSGRRNGDRASAEFKVVLDMSRNIKEQGIDLREFFNPYLDDLENQRSEFFRACVRINMFRLI